MKTNRTGRYLWVMIALAILVFSFTMVIGCGGGSDDGGGSSSDTGAIKGIVYDEYGLALEGATVTYENVSTAQSALKARSVQTDSSGSFTFSNVPVGYYRVTAVKDSCASHMPATVISGEATEVSMNTEPVGSVSGLVTETGAGAYLSGVTVEADLTEGVTISDITGADGRYVLNYLYEGTCTITATLQGYYSSTISATVNQGQTTTGNIAMTPTTSPSPTATPTSSPTPAGKVYALFIGINKYPGSGDDLEYCVNDVNDYRNSFESCALWSGASVTVLTDSDATKTAIQNTIATIKANASSDDLFVMTYSGHGTNDGTNTSLVVWDNGEEGYVYDYELTQWLTDMPCASALYIDACTSGGFIGKETRMVKGVKTKARVITHTAGYDPNFKGTIASKGLESLNNMVVLTACTVDETADENEELQNGLFTYYVVQGLGSGSTIGPAAADSSDSINAMECYYYASSKVVDYSYGEQNPQVQNNYPTIANPTGTLIVKQ